MKRRGKHGRPYPPDRERRVRVKTELAKRDMSIADLARALGVRRPNISNVINGVRRSRKTEARIAAFFGREPGELFPPRTGGEIEAMREAAASRGAA